MSDSGREVRVKNGWIMQNAATIIAKLNKGIDKVLSKFSGYQYCVSAVNLYAMET